MRKSGFIKTEIRQDLCGLDRVVAWDNDHYYRRKNMFDKLDDLLIRFEEVLNELGEPGVYR